MKSRATHVRHRGFFGGAFVRRHRLDPQRRKSSIDPAPAEAAVAFNGGPITSPSLPPVARLSSTFCLSLWHRKAPTARRVRQRLRAVLEWAVATEFRIDNPCDRIGPVLGPQHDVTEYMRALPHREVAAAIRTVWGSTALPAAKLAFEFLVLTAARWGEVRWAEWAEIDRDAGVWTVPARRTKANRQHRVPLGGRALEILEAARTLGEGAGPLVFTRGQGKPLDDKQLRWLLREQGIAAVPHGFRSSFRDWAGEETDHPREVIEAALAHVVRNRVEAAYARSDQFERRRVLMDDWARYLAQGTGEDQCLHRGQEPDNFRSRHRQYCLPGPHEALQYRLDRWRREGAADPH